MKKNRATNKYPINIGWSDEDAEYVATCSAFPGLSAFGETAEEALAEAKVALEAIVETFEEEGRPLPEPLTISNYSGQLRLRLAKSLHRQAAAMANEDGVSLNQFIVDALQSKVSGWSVAKAIAKVYEDSLSIPAIRSGATARRDHQ